MKLSDYLLIESRKRIYDGPAEEIVSLVGDKPNAINILRTQLHYAKKLGQTNKEREVLKAIELLKKGVKPTTHTPKPSPQIVKPEQPKTTTPVKTESGAEKILNKMSSLYSPKESLKKIEKFLETNKALTDIERKDLEDAKNILTKRLSVTGDEEEKAVTPIKQRTKATYDEIGKEHGVTKMGAKKITQKALSNFFKKAKGKFPEASSEEIVYAMMKLFDPDKSDIKNFYEFLPTKTKEKLHKKAVNEELIEEMKEFINESFK